MAETQARETGRYNGRKQVQSGVETDKTVPQREAKDRVTRKEMEK